MCDGAPDECIGFVVTPIVIVLLPIVGILRIGKYIFYDMPKSLLIKKWKKPSQAQAQAQPQQPHRPQQPQQPQEPQDQVQEEQPEDDEPQPPSLRIKIPVVSQADIGFTPHIHLRNPNRPLKTLRWSQDHC